MPSTGLRERKKARTRRLIAETAARLFAERGYEEVSVSDVAREAEVAEQTVYNYFRTKEQLVTDRGQEIQDRLCELIRSRPPTVTPAAAIREFVLEFVAGIRGIPPDNWRGELGYLAAISPTVHRLLLVDPPPGGRSRQRHQRHDCHPIGGRGATGDRVGRRVPDHQRLRGPAHARRPEPGEDR